MPPEVTFRLCAHHHSLSCFNTKSSPHLLFGMEQCPLQVSLQRLSGDVCFPFLDSLEYRRVLLCIAQQQCLCASRCDVVHPSLRSSCRSYRRGEERIMCCSGNHAMKGSIALAPLLPLLGLCAPLVEGHQLAQFPSFVRCNPLPSQAR